MDDPPDVLWHPEERAMPPSAHAIKRMVLPAAEGEGLRAHESHEYNGTPPHPAGEGALVSLIYRQATAPAHGRADP
jgi:hypothetical protein